jgi:membrane protease YdiL (CAAX protease family)
MDCTDRPLVALAIATLLMVVAVLENTVAPWAPFCFALAVLTLGLPWLIGTVDLSQFRLPRLRYALAGLGLGVVLQGVFRLMTARADLTGMFGQVFTVAAGRLGRSPEAVGRWYLVFVQAWAGLGEEVFYRGYLQRTLRSRFAPLPSMAGAAIAFAVRHYSQVLLAWPHVDWASATVWVAATFVAGLVFGWLYERSTSLWPSILCHYVLNLLA